MNIRLILPLLLAATALTFNSCSKPKSENPEARALLQNAYTAFETADYPLAIANLDSLQKQFPGELDIQREGMGLRPRVIEQMAKAGIEEIDAQTKEDMAMLESIKPSLKWVKSPEMIEGYWVDAKTHNPQFLNITAIQPRVSEIGQFYIVSSVNPAGKLHHTYIEVSAANQSAATPQVPYDGESNYRLDGGEVITFSPEQSDTIGSFVSALLEKNPKASLTLAFRGASGAKTQKLTQAQAQAIANTWRYSRAVERARQNEVNRQHLEATASLARRQIGLPE